MFTIVVTIFTLSNYSYAFLLLRAKDLGVPVDYAPLLYLLFNVVYAISAFPIGTLADKVGKKLVISIGYAMFGVTCLGFALASSPIHAILLFLAYGLFFATADAVQRAIVPDLVTAEVRGTAFGVLHTSIGFMALPSGLIAGALWQFYGAAVPFIVGAAVSLISTMLLALLPTKTKS